MTNNKGFTLVELMISIAMTGIIIAAVYSVYTLQQKTSTAQDQVVEMQQNIRAAMLTMVPELRMAGFDPISSSGATISAATVSGITFSQDLNEDGDVNDPNENITYGPSGTNLGRNTGAGLQPIAENIEAIEFLYTMENGSQTITPTPSNIRSITISILARASWQDPKFVNSTVYTQASAVPPPLGLGSPRWDLGAGPGVATNDNFRRRLLITTVQCRNMGL